MAKYRLLNRFTDSVVTSRDASEIAVYVSSRHIADYILIKSDEKGHRIYTWHTTKLGQMTADLLAL